LLDEVDRFDAAFFGISPREAAATDPQQRLMLELGREALEEAGILPGALAGSRTAFAAAIRDDYAALHHRRGEGAADRHSVTGPHRGILANRLSYVIGLTGPSLTVDSAQSSSLGAVHLARESLGSGESDLAVVGGVNLVLSPHSSADSTRFGALSPVGRCFTFDERANGYARGEGGVAVVLKPLDRALADGDRVHCVILGSAVTPRAPASTGSAGSGARPGGEPSAGRRTARGIDARPRPRAHRRRPRPRRAGADRTGGEAAGGRRDAEPHAPLPEGVLASVALPAERERPARLAVRRPGLHRRTPTSSRHPVRVPRVSSTPRCSCPDHWWEAGVPATCGGGGPSGRAWRPPRSWLPVPDTPEPAGPRPRPRDAARSRSPAAADL
jgi:3-oxoacyl-(acyl-carrier-protein) synthase